MEETESQTGRQRREETMESMSELYHIVGLIHVVCTIALTQSNICLASICVVTLFHI